MNQNYAREAKQRWGETDAYKESERRTAKYSKDDFEKFESLLTDISTNIFFKDSENDLKF